MCGSSGAEKKAFANEQTVSGLFNSIFQQFAGENKGILDDLKGTLTPISEAGPSQFGLSPAAEAAERTTAAENISAAGTNASNAVRAALASRGGGSTYLPSGSEASIIGSLAQDTAVKEALAQSGITQHGYDVGRQNWEFATGELAKAPGELENPVTAAGEGAVGAAKSEMEGGQAITQADNAWMAPVGGILGGVASGLTAGLMGGKTVPSNKVQGPSWATGG